MIKLKKVILSEGYVVIGFVAEGKAKEFGEVGTGTIQRRVSTNDLISAKFKNNQVEVLQNGVIKEVGDFKLKSLEAEKFIQKENKFVPCNTDITLLGRVLVDGELKGFDVSIAGTKARLMSADIINRTGIFNTTNFVIRKVGDKKYIAGKPGMSIDTLPSVSLTSSGNKTGRKAKRAGAVENAGMNMVRISYFDMITLCDVLEELGGKFVYLPGVVYNRTTAMSQKVSSDFKKTGVEVAKPEIAFSEKKVNVNIPFNQIGQLALNIGGTYKTFYPFVYKTKTVFKGGKLNAPYLGLVVKNDKVDELQKRFGASMSLSVITDVMANMYVKMLLNVPDADSYTLLALNTTNLSPMNKASADKYLLSEKEIYDLTLKMLNIKPALSYVKGLKKELETLIISEGGSPRPLYGVYKLSSDEELEALKEAGVDVFTGAYTKVEEAEEKEGEAGTDAGAVEVGVEVSFGIDGMKSTPSYGTISKGKEKALAKFPKALEIVNAADGIFKTSGDPNEQYKKLEALEAELNKQKKAAVKTMWLNNVAAYTLGVYQDFKVKDRSHWTTSKTVKNGVVWSYTGTECAGLSCTVCGTTLV